MTKIHQPGMNKLKSHTLPYILRAFFRESDGEDIGNDMMQKHGRVECWCSGYFKLFDLLDCVSTLQSYYTQKVTA